ncbi:MAG: isocitrate dehydrogenase (NADP(+)) [Candidatus Electryonea clarkiae]|nr:isocitrate dehydrogenase (NADP(+)) [Candidatus Electryonea clarkiae]MDP8285118.1 isocitrate dehydrogenase (NADP(+)) [Candidatus Electryonea clarkiae]
MPAFDKIIVPADGEAITIKGNERIIPDNPIIPFIEGDGIGRDIWKACNRVFDAAVEKAYGGKRKVHWMETYAGEKAVSTYGGDTWMPEETFDAIRHYLIAIKGPLTTPVGGGFRSLNVTLRQVLNLYACVRPVRFMEGVPSPSKRAAEMDMIIFRENTEDVYSGVEFESNSEAARRLIKILKEEYGKTQIRDDAGIGIKPMSPTGTKQLGRKAFDWAIAKNLPSITFMHKGNIMKYTEGAFKNWGYELAIEEYRDHIITEAELWDETVAEDGVTPIEKPGAFADLRGGKPTGDPNGRIVVKDRIADSMFQQIQTRPGEYSVVVTPNLNGDYISDAGAAMVGGLGLAPGANIGDHIGLFEATHGTAPKYADKDVINPSSLMLSGAMMFDYMEWDEAANTVRNAIQKTITQKQVTYDLHRQMEGATKLKTSEYASAIIENM